MRTGHFKETAGQLVALSDSRVVWAWRRRSRRRCSLAPRFVGAYALTLMVSALIAVIGAVALNMLTGQTGLISLGQAGFLAVGAYANAILLADYHVPVWLSLPAAGLGAALVSLFVGVPVAAPQGPLSRDHHAGVLVHRQSRDPLRRTDHPRAERRVRDGRAHCSASMCRRARRSTISRWRSRWRRCSPRSTFRRTRIGRACMAIRDHDIAARVMGIDLVRYKLLAFVLSSFFVGVAGALMSLQLRFVNVDVFALILSIEALAIIILGGLGSIAGAVLGAVFLSFLPEALRLVFAALPGRGGGALSATTSTRSAASPMASSSCSFLRFKPDGLIGFWRDARKYWSQWPLAY